MSPAPIDRDTKPVRAVVLSGGGAKGAYEAGVLTSLLANEAPFDIVCGTSIGAINAAFVAQDDLPALASLWHTISQASIIKPIPQVGLLRQLYHDVIGAIEDAVFKKVGDVLHALGDIHALGPIGEIAKLTGALDQTGAQRLLARAVELNHVKRVLITSATNLTSRTADTFYIFPEAYRSLEKPFVDQSHDGAIAYRPSNFAETIRASGAIPAAFKPVTLRFTDAEDCDYVDGGVTNNTPIGQAINAGATEITILYVDPDPDAGLQSPQPTSNLAAILMGCFSMMQQRILDLDFDTAVRINRSIEAGRGADGKTTIRLRAIYPKSPLDVGIIEFDKQDKIDAVFERGVADGRHPPPFITT